MSVEDALRNIQEILKEHSRILQSLEDRVSELDSELRNLSYKVDDLDFKLRMHEKAHQFSEDIDDELYEEPTPALGGIAGAISPTGRFMRW